ncbi:MAG: ribosome silencing factor [SAR202 cluster bacterium]|nr:ribosome silencing factor [SAR202 cluster bacterium]
MKPLELARAAVDTASDKQATDIVLLDVQPATSFTDYLVIMSAGSQRQLVAVADDVEYALKQKGVTPHHREGSADSGWVLLDYVDVVIHVFSEEQRDFYRLEQIWKQAKPLVRIQ